MPTPERWAEVERLYHAALTRPEDERAAFLLERCATDETLRHEVESLLAQQSAASGFLSSPAVAHASGGMAANPSFLGGQLGPYAISALIGQGGMGEVYRARDTKLGRDVAIKILPQIFTSDPERLARFEREARVLASLNHPHIGAIYGLEERDGVRALVLELVDGDTLADCLARGPIPVTEVLTLARQIAEALEAAHERGIVHRDLKPANIKITPHSVVKVLDFGLAKLVPAAVVGEQSSDSPTLTLGGTKPGAILGTAAYMSPEQARGQAVDKRTDIWAFGCVLYEMLSGRRPFGGDTLSDTIAAILERDPDWAALPVTTPTAIRRLLRRTLEKDCRRRLADISDARLDIDEALPAPSSKEDREPAPEAHPAARRLVIPLAVGLTVAIIAGSTVWWRGTREAPPRVTRTTIAPPTGQTLSADTADRFVAIAPDGRHLAFLVFRGPQSNRLFVRAMDQLEPIELTGLGDTIREPFFSPDGGWIGFFDVAGLLKKVAITGGPAVTVCRFDGSAPRGATWGADGTITFATSDTSSGLWQVPASGGEPKMLTKPNREQGERDHLWPRVLAGSQTVLFTIMPTTGGIENAQVAMLDVRTGTQQILVPGGSDAQYVATGHLVYGVAGALRAVPFDLNRSEVLGTPIPVVQEVANNASGGANPFDVASDGTLVYLSGRMPTGTARTLVWVDRHGVEEPLGAPPRTYSQPRVSPDGTRVIVTVAGQGAESDIWLWDSVHKTPTRLTFDPGTDWSPIWAADGRHMFFTSMRSGSGNLFSQMADGAGTPERLVESPTHQYPTSVLADGTQLVFTDVQKNQVLMLSLDNGRVTPLVQTPFAQRNGDVSPDGRWLAYESNESGQSEIYVRPFPNVNSGPWLVSNTGGTRPRWARDSHELFYVAPPGALMSVRVAEGSAFTTSEPVKLFEGHYYYGAPPFLGPNYDVSPDGRFLMIKQEGEAPPLPNIVIVQNWTEELKRLVPAR